MQVLTEMQLTPDTAFCFAPVEQNLATAGLPVNVTVLNWTNPLPNATLYDMVRWHCCVMCFLKLPAACHKCQQLMTVVRLDDNLPACLSYHRHQPAGPPAVPETQPTWFQSCTRPDEGCRVFCC